jgi:DinB superfamily
MHPRIQEVLAHLDTQRADLEQAVAEVPASLRARRPGPDRWSVAEVLEHLTLVETRIGKLLGDHLTAAREAGLGPERDQTPVVPTLNVAALLDRSRSLTASDASLPRGEQGADAALAALTERRRAVRAMVIGADGLALGDVMIPHTRLGPLNVYQWLLFLGAHEGRHAAQIREIGATIYAQAKAGVRRP